MPATDRVLVRLTAFATALFVAVPLWAQTPADAAIDKAVAAYAKVKTARATFTQSISNPLTSSKLLSEGEFEQSRPNRFAFRFSKPKDDRIISDGKYVWAYLPSSAPGQVIRMPLEGGGAGSLDLIAEFFTSPRTRYVVGDGGAATILGRSTRAVTLLPRGEASFVRAKVWIDTEDGTLRQFEAEEHSGITRLVTITRFDANAVVDAKRFTFKAPKGVRVVDQKGLMAR